MDPLSRQASQNAMGPWFVRDDLLPHRPGCSYETLKVLVAKGRVDRESILRGPSTRQFWARATNVPGVAHLLGECHACHARAASDSVRCQACAAAFDCSMDRQALGLAPVRLLPGHTAPEEIARSMVEAVRHSTRAARAEPLRRFVPTGQPTPASGVLSRDAPRSRTSKRRPGIVAVVGLMALVVAGAGTAWVLAPERIAAFLERSSPSPTGVGGDMPQSTPKE
jgi:hypothetical protein